LGSINNSGDIGLFNLITSVYFVSVYILCRPTKAGLRKISPQKVLEVDLLPLIMRMCRARVCVSTSPKVKLCAL